MKPLLLTMMQGLGDAVYQRPCVRAQSEVRPVFVDSCWPEIYGDLPGVQCVRPRTQYRTQGKNLARLDGFPWVAAPADAGRAQFTYSLQQPGSISEELERRVGLAGQCFAFDLPDFGPSPAPSSHYAVIRPVSVRREWLNTARNPDPAYIAQAAELLAEWGYTVICVADLAPRVEDLVGDLPEADIYWTSGELDQPALFALVRHAALVVGGPGWIVPVAAAYRTPAVIIGGGQGGHNAPARLLDGRVDTPMQFVLPEPFCMCTRQGHPCAKQIPDFEARFRSALSAVTARARSAA